MATDGSSVVPSETAINQCSFSSWYPLFRKHTWASKIIPLPESFVDYLLADGILLPPEQRIAAEWSDESDDDDDDDGTSSQDGDNEENTQLGRFSDLEVRVGIAIRQLGGAVFPKLNWSAPKDAAWIATTRTLRCTTFNEIVLLLKSSDVSVYDLLHAYDECDGHVAQRVPAELVLREWVAINPAHEFRCFVWNRRLVAISQRDMAYYAFLSEMSTSIRASIVRFYSEIISRIALEAFVFDVYLEHIGHADSAVKLVDIAPFGGSTNPLLCSWADLMQPADRDTAPADVPLLLLPSDANRMNIGTGALNQFPLEVVDLAYGQAIPDLARIAQETAGDE